MHSNIIFLVIALMLQTIAPTAAQQGYSSASVTMNRSNGVFTPDQVVIEEYLNYHTHKLPFPKRGEEIALSMDWNHQTEEEVILQIGITTHEIYDFSQMPSINTSIVIDKSGSMQSDDKLKKVKRALSKFVKGLRPDDIVSIVVYDTDAQVILPAQKAEKQAKILLAIEGIYPSGSTNLNGGLELGYQEVLKNYRPNQTNRVILLTDGIANVGVVDPEEIVKISASYNKKGIDVSTIGVGGDLNHTLLQQIAQTGRGANYFVGNHQEDITKVFEDELESLLATIGRDVSLEIECPEALQVNEILGYAPKFAGNKIIFSLNNINSGLTQVFLLKFKRLDIEQAVPIQLKLNYYSPHAQKYTSILAEQTIVASKEQAYFLNQEIKKNYAIGKMALALKEMGEYVKHKNYAKGKATLENAILHVEQEFPHLKDKDILRVKNILHQNYARFRDWMAKQSINH
ncbi:vWA domain-containing protein [Aureispira anguillae]|uniref:VWA domain-containing protein n=1 Tax=Aureispira anguillae TaxID=2864201 RepID=A0A916DWD2_9BACT|nr:VWA domain-containing protein [Aureispira anguillae]BDS13931.1 VWA domain-containing protein [Aureispira anguillae]